MQELDSNSNSGSTPYQSSPCALVLHGPASHWDNSWLLLKSGRWWSWLWCVQLESIWENCWVSTHSSSARHPRRGRVWNIVYWRKITINTLHNVNFCPRGSDPRDIKTFHNNKSACVTSRSCKAWNFHAHKLLAMSMFETWIFHKWANSTYQNKNIHV